MGASVTVAGTVTAEAGRLGDAALIAIQDASAGIVIRLPAGAIAPTRGTPVAVKGILAAPYGQLEIRAILGGLVVSGDPAPLPVPLPATAAQLGEATEARLIVLVGTVVRTPVLSAHGLVVLVVDDAGDELRLLTDGFSRIARADLVAGKRYRLTGIVGQRATGKGKLDGYRLWLRDRADIVTLASLAIGPNPGPGGTPDPGSTGGGASVVITIARAVALGRGTVAIEGTVTAGASLLDTSGRRIVVEDASGAIEVRIPAEAAAPGPGRRIRASGTMGLAYGAPRLQATSLEDLGAGPLRDPFALTRAPGASLEWRLVRVAGVVVDVHRLGERWRAELEVGGDRVVVVGLDGARIPATALVAGQRATIVGIVRRPFPGGADRRFAVLPRSSSDLALGPVPKVAQGTGQTSDQGPNGSASQGQDPAGAGSTVDPRSVVTAHDIDLDRLADHSGERVRVGGLVVSLEVDGFTVDDGTSLGRIALHGEATEFLGLVEPGDALTATGRVEVSGTGGPRVVVEASADLVRVSDLGAADPSSVADGLAAVAVGTDAAPSVPPTIVRTAGLAGIPEMPMAGLGGLLLAFVASVGMTVLRRRRIEHRLAARIVERLAALTTPPERVS